MALHHSQRGVGMWGLMYVFGTLGLIGMIGVTAGPGYVNEMKVRRNIEAVASDAGTASADPATLRNLLQRRWDVEDITAPLVKDIKVVKGKAGRAMTYDYEFRANLYQNIDIAVHFKNEIPMRAGAGDGG